MAPSISSSEVYTYSSFTGAETFSLKAKPMKLEQPSSKPTKISLRREPMKLTGLLNAFKSSELTPIVGTEFPEAKVVDWMKGPNSDEMLRQLAITISQRGVVFFRAQTDLTDELQKELCLRLGQLAGKPKENTLHIHPLNNFNNDPEKNINVITTDQSAKPAEDIFRNQAERSIGPRGSWHTDIGYEPHPADYTILKLTKLPRTGGDTLWASACEIYDKISPSYRSFLETLTGTYAQPRYNQTSKEKDFELYTDPRGSPANVGSALKAHHPVVRTNPVTGWKSLFGAGTHFQFIDGFTADESKRLHDWFLQMIVESPDVQCRFKWSNPYDIAIWDNRTTFHTANVDYAGYGARTGHRTVSVGEEPYFDPASPTRREALEADARAIGETFEKKTGTRENLLAME